MVKHMLRLFIRFILTIGMIAPCTFGAAEVWVGKGPYGGEILCMAVAPLDSATLYAGTDGGGIFKSTDRGKNWTNVNAGLTDFSILAITVDPVDSRTVYCSTLHAGMFKSTDGGRSWTAIKTGLSEFSVNRIAVDPMSATTVYAGTPGAGVFKSTNGGHDWASVNAGLKGQINPDGEWIMALVIDRQHPEIVYAGTAYDGLFRSDNGGNTWNALNTGFSYFRLDSLTSDPQAANILYAGGYLEGLTKILKTVDGGDNWIPVAAMGLPQFSVITDMAVDSNESIYVAGYLNSIDMATGIYKSVDGGDNWTPLGEIPDGQFTLLLAIDPHDSSIIYAGSTNSGVYKSSDGGDTWIHSSRGISATNIYAITVDRRNPKTVYASTYQGLYKSTDGGNSWVEKLPDVTRAPVVIDPNSPDTIYVANMDVLKSTDGGDSWRHIDSAGYNVVALAIDPNNPKTLYAGDGVYIYSHHPPASLNGVSRTDDSGETWEPVSGGLPTSEFLFTFVAIDPKNSAAVYAATLSSSGWPSVLYKSADGGGSWNRAWDERDISAMAIDTQNSGVIYAGTTSSGFFRTLDGGDSWFAINNLLKDKRISALAVNDCTAMLYAGTADGGVFQSSDAGDSWTQINRGLTLPGINSLASDHQISGVIYAATSGGVYKLESIHSRTGTRSRRSRGGVNNNRDSIRGRPTRFPFLQRNP